MLDMLDVSVIIVNYNTLKLTDECICSVMEKTSGVSYEIILVDNASTDGSREFFSSDSRVRYIYNEENLGFGRANNKGLEIASGRNVLFLNPDTLLRNNAIKLLSDYLDCHPEAGACGGNLFLADGTPGMSFGRYLPSLYEELNLFFEGLPDKLLYGENFKFNHKGKPMNVGFISGADLMVRHNVLEAVGPFNPRFFLYYEETELCCRIHRSGKTVVSVPEAEIIHLDGGMKRRSASREAFLKHSAQMEKSRAIYYNLSYPAFYGTVAYSLRRMKCFLKSLSPFASTRQRWRDHRMLIDNARKSVRNA